MFLKKKNNNWVPIKYRLKAVLKKYFWKNIKIGTNVLVFNLKSIKILLKFYCKNVFYEYSLSIWIQKQLFF